MALWYHRNVMKNSAFVTFELASVTCDKESLNLCSELRKCRNQLISLFKSPFNQVDQINEVFNEYLSLIRGFVVSIEDETQESKLRFLIDFRWTNSVYISLVSEQADSLFEQLSAMFSVALWFSKHAAAVASKNNVAEKEILEIFNSLKTAARIFLYIKNNKSNLKQCPDAFSDLDDNVLEVYYLQCLAESQEISLARAIELKHNVNLVASLSLDTSLIFKKAVSLFAKLEQKSFLKWKYYLLFKSEIYLAYAYNYYGAFKLSEDNCGEAIKYLEESKSSYTKAEEYGKLYSSTSGAGISANPLKHLFFRKLGPMLQRTMDKCVLENGLIYHQKIPPKVPDLELTANFGRVTVEEYQLPSSNVWTANVYKAFNVRMVYDKSKDKKEKANEKKLLPMKEEEVEIKYEDATNTSGCFIS